MLYDYIANPYYSIKNDKLFYLDNIKICNLSENRVINEKILYDEGALLKEISYNKKTKNVLVLEPHPDDFSLSALGYVFNKYDVIVLNIFSKTALKNFPWMDSKKIDSDFYEKLRIDESKLCIEKLLKQKFISTRLESLRITKKPKETINEIILENIKKIINENKISTIMFPMGIGNHPDHLLIYDILLQNYNLFKDFNIILYPEYPYSRCKEAYSERIKKVKKDFILSNELIDVKDKIEHFSNAIIAYRSQFNEINRKQMEAIIREDTWAIATDFKKENESLIYYKCERK